MIGSQHIELICTVEGRADLFWPQSLKVASTYKNGTTRYRITFSFAMTSRLKYDINGKKNLSLKYRVSGFLKKKNHSKKNYLKHKNTITPTYPFHNLKFNTDY